MSIANQITRITNEVNTQENLITQITTALQGKAAGGGDSVSIETCTGIIEIDSPISGFNCYYVGADMQIHTCAVPQSGAEIIVAKNTILSVDSWSAMGVVSGGAELLTYATISASFQITGDFTLKYMD